jgi:hypothetical protein
MKKIFFYFLLLFSCYSCEKLIVYKDFILKKTPYTGNELRMDGYYYRYFDCGGNNCIAAYCFYRNGILLVVYHLILFCFFQIYHKKNQWNRK